MKLAIILYEHVQERFEIEIRPYHFLHGFSGVKDEFLFCFFD